MNLKERKRLAVIFIPLVLLLFIGPLGCSKEAKKERHWNRGEKYFSENKFREAIIEYKNVLQLEPKDAKTRYKLGLAHLKAGQFREAFSEFSKSVELDGGLSDARV